MRKTKTILLLLLTAIVTACGAVLPGAAAAFMDNATAGDISYAFINSVQLEFAGGAEAEPLPLLGKLSMLKDWGRFINIEKKEASMTEEEVIEAVRTGLSPYYYEELIPYNWSDVDVVCSPYFGFDPNDPNDEAMFNIFWWVRIVYNTEARDELRLIVDDVTGKIVELTYYAPNRPLDEFIVYSREDYLDRFCSLYLEALGLDESARKAGYSLIQENDRIGRRYVFPDEQYGDIRIEIYVHEYGCYTSFPD